MGDPLVLDPLATWHKQPGEAYTRDVLFVDIETDKVVLEVVAPADGALKEIKKETQIASINMWVYEKQGSE